MISETSKTIILLKRTNRVGDVKLKLKTGTIIYFAKRLVILVKRY